MLGDSTKARKTFGWAPRVTFKVSYFYKTNIRASDVKSKPRTSLLIFHICTNNDVTTY